MVDIVEMQKWAYIAQPPDDDDIASMRHLLAHYSRIPARDITAHLIRVRDKAWALSRAPFIGRWKFLRLSAPSDPCYRQVLFRLTLSRSRDAFLDLGCGFGQALRQLRADGVTPSRLYGLDADTRLIALGYDLFRDRRSLGAKLVVADVLDPRDRRLRRLRGKVTIVHAGSFFHLFSRAEQLRIATRVVGDFLRPGTQNAIVYGSLAGAGAGTTASLTRGTSSTCNTSTRTRTPAGAAVGQAPRLLHDADSLQRLWDEVGALTGTRWRVEVELADVDVDAAQVPAFPRDVRSMKFAIFQVP